MTDGAATDLAELVAVKEIGDVLSGYCRGLDRMDRALAQATWHEDGTADYGPAIYVGTGYGFIEWVWPRHASYATHSHQITNKLVKVAGDRAASESYVIATLLHQPNNGIVRERLVRGRYVDEWERRGGRWAIAHRRYLTDISTVRQYPQDEFDFSLQALGRRDPGDPSYEAFGRLGHS